MLVKLTPGVEDLRIGGQRFSETLIDSMIQPQAELSYCVLSLIHTLIQNASITSGKHSMERLFRPQNP